MFMQGVNLVSIESYGVKISADVVLLAATKNPPHCQSPLNGPGCWDL
jgi:hypothetical protein